MTNKTEKSLYNGEVKIIFYPDSHRYKLEGQKGWLVGVMYLFFLIEWRANFFVRTKEENKKPFVFLSQFLV